MSAEESAEGSDEEVVPEAEALGAVMEDGDVQEERRLRRRLVITPVLKALSLQQSPGPTFGQMHIAHGGERREGVKV